MNPTYTAVATSSGRDARAVTADGQLDVQLALPKELGGTGDGLNPEQLLAAGWAACFSTVLDRIGQAQNLDAKDVAVTAEVSLVPAAGRFTLAAVLRIELPDHLQGEPGRKLIEAAHTICPYSTATHGNIPVELIVE
ncbi:Ohr family peroxiredoxin [Kribbella speibonae]|uniref:Ohr family peroxiredoxin n=1 Tax=Kribbella speibonae TaxID=1572660 RepID=A0A4R0INI2_9ACTN|nr:Ohr family peroxiredoxin [Kribbella speibonae]TCC25095.1 Ohr family peroxiredoxin [Kribbella speibonae]TCC32916.1 Ohr family peroxiredoxin [Kribbella speibonae]